MLKKSSAMNNVTAVIGLCVSNTYNIYLYRSKESVALRTTDD